MEKNNKKAGRSKIVTLLAVLLIIAVIVIIILAWALHRETEKAVPTTVLLSGSSSEEPEVKKLEITVEYLDKKLENIGELSTAELSYSGLCTVEEGSIPLLTKKGYSMVYHGTVRAGIDASAIKIDIQKNDVVITVPEAEITMIKVDPESIQFYDEKKALFNWTELEDSVDGIVLAENDIKAQADLDGILERADQQAEYIIRGLLEDTVKEAEGQRDLKIVRVETEQ